MNNNVLEIDLHLHAFMRNTTGLTAEDMIAISIDRMNDSIKLAISKKQHEIRFIHGQGTGQLKTRVYQELSKSLKLNKIRSFQPYFFNPDIVVVALNY